jgi:hypothetical protein
MIIPEPQHGINVNKWLCEITFIQPFSRLQWMGSGEWEVIHPIYGGTGMAVFTQGVETIPSLDNATCLLSFRQWLRGFQSRIVLGWPNQGDKK